MLKELQKALGLGKQEAKPEAAADSQELTLVVDTSAVQAELDGLRAEFESFKETAEAMVAQAEEAVANLTAQLAEANAALAEFRTAAEAAEADKANLIAQAAAQKAASRKEKVVAAIGTEKAEGLLAATENLDDAAFEAVVSALAGSIEAEAQTNLFKEEGVAAEADAGKVVEESKEMKILKAKYGKK